MFRTFSTVRHTRAPLSKLPNMADGPNVLPLLVLEVVLEEGVRQVVSGAPQDFIDVHSVVQDVIAQLEELQTTVVPFWDQLKGMERLVIIIEASGYVNSRWKKKRL